MKHKRIHAVIASVLIHLIIAAIIGLLLSDHYWTLNDDAIDVRFVKPPPTRDNVRRTHKTVFSPTTQQTVNPLQVPLPSVSQLRTTDTSIQNPTTKWFTRQNCMVYFFSTPNRDSKE